MVLPKPASILPLLCAVLAAGCVRYTPQPLSPADELASLRQRGDWGAIVVAASAPATTAPATAAAGLDEAAIVGLALRFNPELATERAKAGQAQAVLVSAGLWPNPELELSLLAGLGAEGGWRAGADLMQELLRPGQRQSRRAVAEARLGEVKAEMLAAEHRVAADARRRWIEVLAAQQALSLLAEELSLRQQALELVEKRRALGEATELDLASVRVEVAEVQRDRRRAQSELQGAQRALNRAIGLPSGAILPLRDSGRPLRITAYEAPDDDELDRRLLAGRWELAARQAAYRQAEESLRQAVMEQYPKLKLGPAFEHESGQNFLGLGVGLELPIFDRAQGRIAQAKAARDSARADYAALLHRLRAEAFDARDELRRAKLEVDEQQRELLPLVQKSEALIEGAYRARELSVLDWVAARQRSLRARREHLEAAVRYRKALIDLEAATGMFLGQRPTTGPARPAGPPGRPSHQTSTTQPSRPT